MPDCILIKNITTIDDWKAFCGPILESRGYHIAKNPAKGEARKKRQTAPETNESSAPPLSPVPDH